ncbi:pollen allergen ole e 6 [Tanacetum coccineum]
MTSSKVVMLLVCIAILVVAHAKPNKDSHDHSNETHEEHAAHETPEEHEAHIAQEEAQASQEAQAGQLDEKCYNGCEKTCVDEGNARSFCMLRCEKECLKGYTARRLSRRR